MTREAEITILQSLKGDTYFSQYFGADIDRMCYNIERDFAIECGCNFAVLLAQAGALDDCDSAVYKAVVDEVGRSAIIQAKRNNGDALLPAEIDWLCEQAGIVITL